MSNTSDAVAAWEALFRAQVTVMRQLSAEFPGGDVSFNDYDVLFTLSRAPDHALRLHELGENLLLTQPSVSRLIDRLASRALVTKNPDPQDGRGVIVELTELGFTAFRRAAVRHMESITHRVGGTLTAQELAQLTALCEKLRAGDPQRM